MNDSNYCIAQFVQFTTHTHACIQLPWASNTIRNQFIVNI